MIFKEVSLKFAIKYFLCNFCL